MLSSDEAELKLSPQSLSKDNAVDVNNPTINLEKKSPTLPSRNDEKDSNSSALQEKGQVTLTLATPDVGDKDEVTLPSNIQDSKGRQAPDEMKCHEEKNDRRVNFPSELGDTNLLPSSARSLDILTDSAPKFGKAKSELSLEDNVEKRPKGRSEITHRQTAPNLMINKKSNKENIAMFFPPSQWSARYGIQFFTVVIPKVTVVKDYEDGPKGTYALYQIEIKRGRQVIGRNYRFSQFSDFHQALLRSSISIILQQAKIYLPAKTWFKNLSPSFLEQRRSDLEKYLHRLLQFKYSTREAIVQKFLALNEFNVMEFWIDH